jgi:predicted RNase H-like HicB family nuclease
LSLLPASVLPIDPEKLLERLTVDSETGGGNVKHYHINVFFSEQDEGYIADIPDLEACSAFGRTPEEAVAEVARVREAWLDAARLEGRAIPEPHYRPAVESG